MPKPDSIPTPQNNVLKIPSIGQLLYHFHRRRALQSNPKQMAWGQVISLIGTVLSGYLLELNKEALIGFTGAILIIPGVFDLSSSLGAAMSAKINHQLEATGNSERVVYWRSVWFGLRELALGGLIVAAVASAIAATFFGAKLMPVFGLALGSLAITGLLGLPLIGRLTLTARRRAINPDDIIGPVQSSLLEIFSLLSIIIFIALIGTQ